VAWSIAEVARMSKVTSRTLRHYDDVGLLRPAYVGSNGYRYYEQEQCSNRYAMRKLARAWPRQAIAQQPVGPLPSGYVTVLLDPRAISDQFKHAVGLLSHSQGP